MTMEYMGNLGSMIGGLAIFVSLLYLAVETRVNTKAIRSAAYHSAAVSMADSVILTADRELGEIFLKSLAQEEVEEFSAVEQMQFSSLASQLLLRYEDVFAQHQQGAVPPELWEMRRRFGRSLLELPMWKSIWEVFKNSPTFTPAFIEEIETAKLVRNEYIGYAGPEPALSA